MRRIDEVKNKKMKSVKFVRILDKKRIEIVFNNNNSSIIVEARPEDYGYDSGIYIEKDTI